MKNTTLALLCCSAFLVACDNATDTAESVMDSAKKGAGDAMNAAKETATDAVASGKDLKEVATESAAAAVEAVKETTSAAVEKSGDLIAAVTGGDTDKGESIYKKSCNACHGTGVAGSPKLGDKAAWSARISQGNAVLTKHAIEGYKGETGYMPPKGGFMSLSDEDIAATVMYMVSQSQ